jgi:protein SCO1/2
MSRKHIFLIGFFFLLTLFLVGVNLLYTFQVFDKNKAKEQGFPAFAIPEFRFNNQEGVPFGTEELRGKVWVANFIFTRCPGPCPLMTRNMAALQQQIEADSGIQFVTFTVDPDYDIPEVLKTYGENHGADWKRWTFLTGERSAMHPLILNGFKLSVAEASEEDLPITGPYTHSTLFVVVGKDGKTRGYLEGSSPDFLKKMQRLLAKTLKEPS